MKRKLIKPAVFSIIQFLIITNLYCQVKENMIDFLTGKFEDYIHAVPWEEIYMHTDRENYIAGEDLWFNIYLIDRQTLKSSSDSKIAYFELLNSENRPIVQKRILINKGFGPGQLQLPDTLSSGTYTIRVYTNWMKNFLPDNCFYKDINVFNALYRGKFRQKSFPGKSEDEVISENNNVLKKDQEIVLKTEYSRSAGLEITITSGEKFASENSNLLYLFIQTHGIIDHVSAQRITGNITRITLPDSALTKGIAHITVFDSKGLPVCEKYTYIPREEQRIVSLSSAESFGAREKININLESLNRDMSSLDLGNLSISVSPVTNDKHSPDLNEYMIIGTEFGQNILNRLLKEEVNGSATEIFDPILENAASRWISWAGILSDDIPQFKYGIEKENHFLAGKVIDYEKSATSSPGFVLLFLPGSKAEFQYANIEPEGNFKFNIHIDEEYKDLIIMPDGTEKKRKVILDPSFPDNYLRSESSVDSSGKSIPSYVEEWSVNYQVSKIYGSSSAGNFASPVFSPLKPVRFYGKPDIELIMSEYVSLPEMEEVFFELLPHVSLKKKGSGYEILISDRVNEKRFELTPDIFLDGVKINDPVTIADLDPLTVEKIEVVREIYVTGKYFFPGIVNVITKAADFSSTPLPDYMIRLPYRTVDPVMSFVSPDYSKAGIKESPIPDFRNTLYWNPSLKPDSKGSITEEFWTSDIASVYEINLQGISGEGEIITARKLFTVE